MRSLVIASMLLVAAPLAAQGPEDAPHDPVRLFPREAPVDVHGVDGLVRLPLTAEVLAATRPDLSDLRLHDAADREVPFLVDSGARPRASERPFATYALEPTELERRVERGDSLRAHYRERLVVSAPGEAPEGARWTLRLDSRQDDFVRSVVVRRLGGPELARGTVFRLADPVRERLTVELPPLSPADGPLQLEIEVVGEGGYVEPTVQLTATTGPVAPPTLSVPLPIDAQVDRDGRTVYELARPVGLAPDRIRLTTDADHFYRSVRVLDLAQGRAARELGRGVVFRVASVAGAERLEIDVSRADGERIRIEIDDGDSPPLSSPGFEAVVRQPTLVFDADGRDLRLRFGGGRAHRARYDVQRFVGTWLGDRLVALDVPEASLGEPSDNVAFDDGPALRFAMRPGRAAELPRFTHVAPVTVEGAREGLSRLRLPPAVLSIAAADLSDVRIVDGEGRQWPYLTSPHLESDRVDAEIGAPVIDDRRSTYAIALPVDRVVLDRLVVHTSAPYVDRPYVLRGIDERGRRVELSRGRLTRAPDEAAPLELAFEATRVSEVALVVEDGSDAPLPIDRVELSMPSATLFLAAPDGSYRLLVGDAEAEAPAYEIARATDLVLAVKAADATVGAPAANPAHVEPAWYASADWHVWLLWGVLLFAVVVLGVLTLRLARHVEDDPPAGEAAAPEPSGDGEPPGSPPAGDSSKPVSF